MSEQDLLCAKCLDTGAHTAAVTIRDGQAACEAHARRPVLFPEGETR